MDDYEARFTTFFIDEYARVVRTVYLIVGDWRLAEDLAQEAFVRSFVNKRKLFEYDRPGAWVRRVAIRLSLRSIRRSKLAQRHGDLFQASGRADDDIMSSVQRLDIARAIRKLSPMQRAVVGLFYLGDLSVGEVADILGCSEGTVKSHLHRARGRLAKDLAEGEEPNAINR